MRRAALTTALTALLASGCADVVELTGVAYDQRFGDATTMDVYLPDDGLTGRPAVLWIHGGGWKHFSRSAHTDHAIRLARAGYVSATINYRLVPDGSFPRAPQDCLCALAYLRNHADEYGLDPDRIAVAGYSAGGHLASLIGVAAGVPELAPDCAAGATYAPAAVISGAGPEDLLAMGDGDAVRDFVGGTPEEVPERYELASPISHVSPDAPPFLFVHGTGDLFVNIDQSKKMRDALRDAGVQARLLALPGGGHLTNPDTGLGQADFGSTTIDSPQAWAAIIDFLDQTVGAP